MEFYWIPISLSDSTYETLMLRLFSTENTKYFILAEVSFYSMMIILLFRGHPKTSIFLCHYVLFAAFGFKLEPNLLWIWNQFEYGKIEIKKFCQLLSLNLFSWSKKKKRANKQKNWYLRKYLLPLLNKPCKVTLMNKDRKI